MFTGIIQAVGKVAAREPRGGDARLTVLVGDLDMQSVALGDSIAVNGVCLTAVEFADDRFVADVSGESLRMTTLGDLGPGDQVNLEKALTLSTHLGGHLVSGHVDGVGELISRKPDARSEQLLVRAPDALSRYIAAKGSITVNGVSLTVNAVDGCEFMLNIVPHTMHETTLGMLQPGSRCNLEVDLIARYLERLLTGAGAEHAGANIDREFLARHGFN